MRFFFAVLLTSVSGALGGAIGFIGWTTAWLLFYWFDQAGGFKNQEFLYIALTCLPIFATIGGLMTALALRWIKLAVPYQWTFVVAVGWAGGFFLSEIIGLVGGLFGLIVLALSGFIGFVLMNVAGATMGFLSGLLVGWVITLISLVVGGAVGGAIGSSVMFFPIRQSSL